MGGSPKATVERIKNMVYMNQLNGSRDEYLGELQICPDVMRLHVSVTVLVTADVSY